MSAKKLLVSGTELSEEQSWFIIDVLLKNKDIDSPEKAQDYVKNHTIEEREDSIILRNPNFECRHFSFRK